MSGYENALVEIVETAFAILLTFLCVGPVVLIVLVVTGKIDV